jgi:hypothetical protein
MTPDIARWESVNAAGQEGFSGLTVRKNLELGSYATKDYNWGRVTGTFPSSRALERKVARAAANARC